MIAHKRGITRAQNIGHAEVTELEGTILDKEVCGFDVAVHHADTMNATDGCQHLPQDLHKLVLCERLGPLEALWQRALALLHDDVGTGAIDEGIDQPDAEAHGAHPPQDGDLLGHERMGPGVDLVDAPPHFHDLCSVLLLLDLVSADLFGADLLGRVHVSEGSRTQLLADQVLLVEHALSPTGAFLWEHRGWLELILDTEVDDSLGGCAPHVERLPCWRNGK
mmetsp:Transcript_1329/g.3619  ORF Transcript_1329/g.3619 Transcript_1329/m.3619 type:complete len:222 (+) Transcript_1329:927-1592(+)